MRVLSPASSVPTPTTKNADNEETGTTSTRTTSTVPTVVLDTDVVSDNMAARLCVSFLGHVLFLKNQIPFPVVQLARIPTTDDTTRAAKKRQELLNSFDTLASHMYTTFIALSTALALRGTPEKADVETLFRYQNHGAARAYIAVALGPTVGVAKSRVIVGIDGLETKVWGLCEPGGTSRDVTDEHSDEDFSEVADDAGDDEGEGSEDGNEEGEASVSDDDASPPPSRSPSPSCPSDAGSARSDMPLETPTRIEDPEAVRAAERLLSRTLASACAEDDGHGLAAEMAPTQIHVLLRAPRRFDHPSWIPRQNLCTSLDNYLADFLVESGQRPAPCDTATTKRTRANRVQGVWIKSSASISPGDKDSEENLAEEDELIWWSWDGKLAGFTDW